MALATASFEIRSYGRDAARHSHDHHQIVLPLAGALEMEIDRRGGRVSESQAALVAAGTDHSFACQPGDRFLIADLPAARAEGAERLWQAAVRQPFVALDSGLLGLTAFLAGEANRDGGRVGSGLAGDLLLEALARRQGLAPAPLTGALARALAFIEARHGEAITAGDVARAAGLSVSRLQALFHERLGSTIGRSIAERRMKTARALLTQNELPLVEVALRAGYGDQSAFTRAFQRAFGLSPGRFRRAAAEQSLRHRIRAS